MLNLKFIFLISAVFLNCAQSARILGVFPIPSWSHQIVFTGLTTELAKKGHELVVLTPNPLKDKAPHNVTEIDVSFAYEKFGNLFVKYKENLKRGAIMNIDFMKEVDSPNDVVDIIIEEFKVPEMKKLLEDKNQKFDLIILEGFGDYHLIVSEIFKAPAIMISTFSGFPEHYEMMGAPSRHPLFYPNPISMKFSNLGFWDILNELYNEYYMYNHFKRQEEHTDRALKEHFGPNAPTVQDLRENIDMLFLTVNPIFANNRPVPPNVVYLDSLHLQPPKALPQDLQTYLDNSKRGVVYVSLGSNVRPSMMDKDFLDAFLIAFKALPYDILWKFDGTGLENVPENVKIMKWFPQQDLLRHKNIKIFVTQCGIQSTSEAVSMAVPLVGIPMMAEQWFNAQKLVDLCIGVKLDSLTLTADDIIRGVKTVIENKSYKTNIEKLSKVVIDNVQTPLERAVWWTEYVLRHNGARHLRSPAANVSWTEFYMVDFVLKLLALLLVAFSLITLTLYFLVKKITGLFGKTTKTKKH